MYFRFDGGVVIAAFAVLIFATSADQGTIPRFLQIRVFQHLGEIFYSIDLNHAVILLTINPIFKVAKCAFWYYSSHALLFHGFTTLITNLTGNNHTNFGGHIK